MTPGGPPAIELTDVFRTYHVGDAVVNALNGLTLTIARGEFVSIMGPSGSGKTTLLNVLGCLDTPTSGAYRLDGQPVEDLSEDQLAEVRQKKIGFIFQDYQLIPRMTAARNVEVPMIFAGVDPGERKRKCEEALTAVGLAHRIGHRPDQLSGGERQRVAIARATVMNPSFLLADEPTGNLDTHSGDEIVALLRRLNGEGLTIVMVTHNPQVAEQAGRTVTMRDGNLVDDGVSPRADRSPS